MDPWAVPAPALPPSAFFPGDTPTLRHIDTRVSEIKESIQAAVDLAIRASKWQRAETDTAAIDIQVRGRNV